MPCLPPTSMNSPLKACTHVPHFICFSWIHQSGSMPLLLYTEKHHYHTGLKSSSQGLLLFSLPVAPLFHMCLRNSSSGFIMQSGSSNSPSLIFVSGCSPACSSKSLYSRSILPKLLMSHYETQIGSGLQYVKMHRLTYVLPLIFTVVPSSMMSRPPPNPDFSLRGSDGPVTCITFWEKHLLAGTQQGTVSAWSLRTRRVVWSISAHQNLSVLKIAILRDHRLLTQGRDGWIHIWDSTTASSPPTKLGNFPVNYTLFTP